ncbi:transglycosylase SLT domain-containing protein [Thioclava atlantica]|uniref:Transglycosylase, Slt family protein n=1 Tax=Thioclava atlantica TaxID=1317124 RepID=A0A085TVK7_9RHOB|nr:transglycosylase SLT domain-containing protein [Thioclava atlantica]KFE34754.1 transglycosylase, Slt family protein [Thioclava atlantica]
MASSGRLLLLAVVFQVLFTCLALARGTETLELCDRVAERVAAEAGIPAPVLKAISLNETGRKQGNAFRTWPWTVNMEGKGHWFDTRDEALRYVFKEFKRGARSFDLGCFQINYKWHGRHFASIDEMFDPLVNARYAARFLTELYHETGDWSRAAGAYHSRTRALADRYAQRFERFLTKLGAQAGRLPAPAGEQDIALAATAQTSAAIPDIPDIVGPPAASAPRKERSNGYPLLKGGGPAPPLGAAAGASLFAAALSKRDGS